MADEIILYRMEANRSIANSYIHLTNFFLKDEAKECKSLDVLWSSAGKLICKLLAIREVEIKSSHDFYELLTHKLRFLNPSLATELCSEDAANGDSLEICKFYSLFLEYLRKEQGDSLTNILEKLAETRGFDSAAIVRTFAHFDNLYANDCADDWWSILAEKVSELSGFSTPVPRRMNTSMFTTPTTSSRKIRSVVSTARRSPIANAVDSPTMKYMRCDKELKALKMRMADYETKFDLAETENSSLLAENRELKKKLVDISSDFSTERGTIQSLEDNEERLKEELQSKDIQVENLKRSLEESKQSMHSLLRRLEEGEAEIRVSKEKSVALEAAKSSLMKQLMDLRATNESDYMKWQASTNELKSALKIASSENEELSAEVSFLRDSEKAASIEKERLNSIINSIEGTNAHLEEKNHQQKEELIRVKKMYEDSIQKERHDREVAVGQLDSLLLVANETIDRLNAELNMERSERMSFKDELDSLRRMNGQKAVSEAESTETLSSVRSSFRQALSQIETLKVEVKANERIIKAQKSQLDKQDELITQARSLQDKQIEQFKRTKEQCDKELESATNEKNRIIEVWSNKCSQLETNSLELTTQLEILKSNQREVEKFESLNLKLEIDIAELKEENEELKKRVGHYDGNSLSLDDYEEDDIEETLKNAPDYTPDHFGIKPRSTMSSAFEIQFNTPNQSGRDSLSESTSRVLPTSTFRESMRSYNSQKINNFDEDTTQNMPPSVESKKRSRRSIASYVFKNKN